ncbi:MAG: hypothetical protein GQ583_08010 [Methyloprofundus sp.]|nr:hypothetical protein [Methyloprofundus sp.]
MIMKFFIVTVLVLCSVLARFNLPPSENVNDFLSEKPGSNFFEQLSTSVLFSQSVADWTYRDFFFIKFACSDRLKVELIAIPFSKWDIYRQEIKNCT